MAEEPDLKVKAFPITTKVKLDFSRKQKVPTQSSRRRTYLCRFMALTLSKPVWIVLGFTCVGVGIIGYIVPLMPGLVFFILAAFCFAKGSRKFLRKLLANKYVGPQIMDWKRGRGMRVKTKMVAIATIIPSMSFSAFYMVKLIWVKWIIMISAAGIIIYILSVKTRKEPRP